MAISTSRHCLYQQSGVDCVFQCLARLETRNIGGLDLDGLAGLRIATLARGAVFDGKGAETYQGYLIALAECTSDAINYRIESTARRSFGKVSGGSNCINKFSLVHMYPLEKRHSASR